MRRKLLTTICLAVFATLIGERSAIADSIVTSDQLTARLVAEQSQVRPGDTLTIALAQEIAPHWHTYWKNPGDSGQGPFLDWQLPSGAAASGFKWPMPERIAVEHLMNYGYSGNTAQLTEITVPADWPAGTPFPVNANAEILVCEKICIPVSGKLLISVPTGAETIDDASEAAFFRDIRARIPVESPWQAQAYSDATTFALNVAAGSGDFEKARDIYFFPDEWGVVEHATGQTAKLTETGLVLSLPRGQVDPGASLSGVLTATVETSGGPVRYAYRVESAPVGPPPAGITEPGAGLALLLLMALAGGALLNLMPCVFPVLAIKAFGLAKHAGGETRDRVSGSIAYSAGVVVSFLALAAALLAARAAGEAVGWGFQLQSPIVVGLLAYVAAAVGLNLSGVFEVPSRFAGAGGRWTSGQGSISAFATGVLAAVVAAPCTAPFMAVAAGGALLLPAPQALLIFAVMGLGLALPYLALTLSPGIARRLPKPGPWMDTFKQALAFPMYATAAWLIWVLDQQVGADVTFLALLGLILLAAALWLLPKAKGGQLRIAASVAMAAGAIALIAIGTNGATSHPAEASVATEAEPYSTSRLQQLRADDRAVFVNMTAAWCITCKVNERVALSGEDFVATLKSNDIVYLQGDWTNKNAEITRFLEDFGRAGVPLYVLFPKSGGDPVVLPQILDPRALKRALSNVS